MAFWHIYQCTGHICLAECILSLAYVQCFCAPESAVCGLVQLFYLLSKTPRITFLASAMQTSGQIDVNFPFMLTCQKPQAGGCKLPVCLCTVNKAKGQIAFCTLIVCWPLYLPQERQCEDDSSVTKWQPLGLKNTPWFILAACLLFFTRHLATEELMGTILPPESKRTFFLKKWLQGEM